MSSMNIRRVVTGHDSLGKAKVLIDDVATNERGGSTAGQRNTLMWCTDAMPCAMPRVKTARTWARENSAPIRLSMARVS